MHQNCLDYKHLEITENIGNVIFIQEVELLMRYPVNFDVYDETNTLLGDLFFVTLMFGSYELVKAKYPNLVAIKA